MFWFFYDSDIEIAILLKLMKNIFAVLPIIYTSIHSTVFFIIFVGCKTILNTALKLWFHCRDQFTLQRYASCFIHPVLCWIEDEGKASFSGQKQADWHSHSYLGQSPLNCGSRQTLIQARITETSLCKNTLLNINCVCWPLESQSSDRQAVERYCISTAIMQWYLNLFVNANDKNALKTWEKRLKYSNEMRFLSLGFDTSFSFLTSFANRNVIWSKNAGCCMISAIVRGQT